MLHTINVTIVMPSPAVVFALVLAGNGDVAWIRNGAGAAQLAFHTLFRRTLALPQPQRSV